MLIRAGALLCVLLITGCVSVTPGGQSELDTTRLQNAIAMDDIGYVRAAVESRALGINQNVPGIGYEATPLITLAARNAALNVLRYLIASNADVNARTPNYDTPLMLATFFRNEGEGSNSLSAERYETAVRMLVDAGAEIENYNNCYTPLAYAAYQGHERTLRYLLTRGARVNADAQGRMTKVNTPLMMAAMQGHETAVRDLLRAGADAGVRVQDGLTAVEFAQKNRHTQLVPMLRCAENLRTGESFTQRCER
jgi:ankyrin repeat protein